MRNILIVAGGAVAVAAIAAGVYFGPRAPAAGRAPTAVAAAAAPDKSTLLAVQPGVSMRSQHKTSKWLWSSDVRSCDLCANFYIEIMPDVRKEWIDTGKVKLVYRDFPL